MWSSFRSCAIHGVTKQMLSILFLLASSLCSPPLLDSSFLAQGDIHFPPHIRSSSPYCQELSKLWSATNRFCPVASESNQNSHLSSWTARLSVAALRGGGRRKSNPTARTGDEELQTASSARSVRSSVHGSAPPSVSAGSFQSQLKDDENLEADHSSQLLRELEEGELSQLQSFTDKLRSRPAQKSGSQATVGLGDGSKLSASAAEDLQDDVDGEHVLEDDSSLDSGAEEGEPLLDRLASRAVLNHSMVEGMEEDFKKVEEIKDEVEKMKQEEERRARESEDTDELLAEAAPLTRKFATALRSHGTNGSTVVDRAAEDVEMEEESDSEEDWRYIDKYLRVTNQTEIAAEIASARNQLLPSEQEDEELLSAAALRIEEDLDPEQKEEEYRVDVKAVFGADVEPTGFLERPTPARTAKLLKQSREIAVAHPREVMLWEAARQGNQTAIDVLLLQGAQVNFGDPFFHNATALHCAAGAGHASAIKLLVERGADVRAAESVSGMTALHEAASSGHARAVHMLVELGADVNAANCFGATPADCAYAVRQRRTSELGGEQGEVAWEGELGEAAGGEEGEEEEDKRRREAAGQREAMYAKLKALGLHDADEEVEVDEMLLANIGRRSKRRPDHDEVLRFLLREAGGEFRATQLPAQMEAMGMGESGESETESAAAEESTQLLQAATPAEPSAEATEGREVEGDDLERLLQLKLGKAEGEERAELYRRMREEEEREEQETLRLEDAARQAMRRIVEQEMTAAPARCRNLFGMPWNDTLAVLQARDFGWSSSSSQDTGDVESGPG